MAQAAAFSGGFSTASILSAWHQANRRTRIARMRSRPRGCARLDGRSAALPSAASGPPCALTAQCHLTVALIARLVLAADSPTRDIHIRGPSIDPPDQAARLLDQELCAHHGWRTLITYRADRKPLPSRGGIWLSEGYGTASWSRQFLYWRHTSERNWSDDALSILQSVPCSAHIRFWPMDFGLWPHIYASARRRTPADCLHRRHYERPWCIRRYGTVTQRAGGDVLAPHTVDAQADELRRTVRESEQRRKAAEVKLADRERRLDTVINNYALDFPGLFHRTGAS